MRGFAPGPVRGGASGAYRVTGDALGSHPYDGRLQDAEHTSLGPHGEDDLGEAGPPSDGPAMAVSSGFGAVGNGSPGSQPAMPASSGLAPVSTAASPRVRPRSTSSHRLSPDLRPGLNIWTPCWKSCSVTTSPHSARGVPSVYHESRARYVASFVGGEVHNEVRNVLRLADRQQRLALEALQHVG